MNSLGSTNKTRNKFENNNIRADAKNRKPKT